MSYFKGKIIGLAILLVIIWITGTLYQIRRDGVITPTTTATPIIETATAACLPVWSVECQATASAQP